MALDDATADPTVAEADDAQNREAKRARRYAGLTPFKPGNNANPGGRPRLPAEVRSAAQGYTPSALKRLAALAGLSLDGKLVKPTGTPAVQLGAAQTLLDRAWGRAEQALHLSTDDGARLPTLDSAGLKRLLTAIAALEADEAAIDVTPDSPPDTEKP